MDGNKGSRSRIDRSPMVGKEGRRYLVLGEKDRISTNLAETDPLVFSLRSPARPPVLYPNVARVLYLAFFDIEESNEIGTCRAISGEEAALVARTIHAYAGKTLVFQCERGVGRSAGMCQAVAAWYDDAAVVDACSHRYAPNQTVRGRVYAALLG